MAHLPNPISYAAGHLKSFYYKWEGQTSQMGGMTACRRTGEKKKIGNNICVSDILRHIKPVVMETGIHLTSYYEHILIHISESQFGNEILVQKSAPRK